jgi:hypothetical protein
MRNEFIFVKNSLLYFYRKVPLYYYADNGKCVLYKPAGITLKEMRIKEKLLPKKLYIKQKSKVDAIKEVQQGYNDECGYPQSLSCEVFGDWVNIPFDFIIGDFNRFKHLLDNAHKLFTNAL